MRQPLARPTFLNGIPFRVGFAVLPLFLLFKLLTLSKAYNQCNTILETQNDLGTNEALHEMAALKGDLNQSTHYLRGYADLLFNSKRYDAAIEKYNMALNYTSDPNLYMEIGNCYSKRGRFIDAEQAYNIAANIEPHLFAPKYDLMKLYGYAKDTIKARQKAQEIIAMNPKVESEKVDYYKMEAKKVVSY